MDMLDFEVEHLSDNCVLNRGKVVSVLFHLSAHALIRRSEHGQLFSINNEP